MTPEQFALLLEVLNLIAAGIKALCWVIFWTMLARIFLNN